MVVREYVHSPIHFFTDGPRSHPLLVRQGKVYATAVDLKANEQGLLEIEWPIPPVAQTGWPTLDGNLQNHRQQP